MQHKPFPGLLITNILVLHKSVTHVKKLNTYGIILRQRNTIFYFFPPQILNPSSLSHHIWRKYHIRRRMPQPTGTAHQPAEGGISQRRKGPQPRCMSFLFNESGPFRREVSFFLYHC